MPTAAPPRPNPNVHGHGPEHQPRPQANDEKLRIVLTSLDNNVDAFAREAAHEKLSQRPEGRFLKRAIKSAWHQMKREYDIVKETQRAREEIRESGNLLHHHGTSDAQWREAIVSRRTAEFGEQLVREGETFHNLSSPEAQNDPEAQQIRADILDTARRFARGEIIDADSLYEEQKRRNEDWKEKGISQKYLGEAEFLAENELAMCEQAKAAYEAAKAQADVDEDAELEKLLANADVIVGEGKVGSTAEIEATLSERLAGKMKNSKFLTESRIAKAVSFLGNETTVAAIASVAIAAGKSAFSKGVAAVAIPGLGGGAIAALRERKALKQERALERRRLDRGLGRELVSVRTEDMTKWERTKDFVGMGPNSRRAELGETLYQTRGAQELIGNMGDLYDENGDLKMRSRAELDGAMQQLAEVKARIKATDTGDTLIGFGGVPEEEKENVRTDLMLAMSKLEADLGKLFTNPAAAAMLDIKATENFEDLVKQQQGMIDGVLKGEMKQADKLFNKLVAKRAGGRAILGGVTGMFASLGVHAAGGMLGGGSGPQTLGVQRTAHTGSQFSGTTGGAGAPTDVGGGAPPVSVGGSEAPVSVGGDTSTTVGGSETPSVGGGQEAPTVGGESSAGGEYKLSDTSRLNLPDGYGSEIHGDTLTVTTPDGQTIEGLKLNSDGSLTAEAQQSLEGAGLHVKDEVEFIKGEPQVTKQEVSASDFARNHLHEMKTIHHKGWMDQGGNELKLQNSVDAGGNIIISISGMAGNGSFHGASGVNWHDAAVDGHMKAYVSAGVGSQAHAFEFTFNTDGIAVVDKDSPAAALFDSHGQPIGGFEEASLNTGQAADGGENIVTLATAVGAHHETLTDTITTASGPEAHHTYTVTPTSGVNPSLYVSPGGAAATAVSDAASSVFTPIYGRERLGKARDEEALRAANARRNRVGEDMHEEDEELPEAETPETEIPDAETADDSDDTETPGNSESEDQEPADEGDGGETGPNPTPESEDNEQEDTDEEAEPQDAEQDFLNKLDAEALDTPYGYSYPGDRNIGQRERKQAVRFIREAMAAAGENPDKNTVIAAALAAAQAAATQAAAKSESKLEELFNGSATMIQQLADFVKQKEEAGSKREAGNESLFEDLDDKAGIWPFFNTRPPSSMSPQAQNLVARIYRKAVADTVAEKGPEPLRGDPARRSFYKTVYRKALNIAHIDQYPNLTDEQKQWAYDATAILSQAKVRED